MARPAKPWWRKQTGWWMVKIGGKQAKLLEGPDDEHHRILAEEKFVELRRLHRIAPEAPTARTADVIESFLRWSRQHLTEETHRVNKYYCQLFAEHCGAVLARDLRPFHVTRWISTMMSPERVERELARRKADLEAEKVTKRQLGRAPKVWGRPPPTTLGLPPSGSSLGRRSRAS
jgi:hypothetical protein